ncbi:MAG TPA: 50S ribosomal protein L3 [Syntrophales bacterium]|jgi:large subunit ribosomal protein L3|nr:50S ribosomal protein L3 [Syntrophales bacterium]HPX55759.1 50S ribosomal protein L3 [Syntrophales bacterium]HQA82464.1 50S ribosomal protein L3 [Syntrophales bacterium]
MKKGLIGKKLGMTQIFAEDGEAIPVTVIEMEPSVVIQKKTVAKDGYDAIQLGYGRIKQSHVTKPLQGHFKHAGKGAFRFLREVPGNSEEYELGQEVKAEIFNPGEYVDITGTTKGKGYAGVIKRHGFGGGRSSHGSMFHRAPGSIGASADPSRVFKGTRLPGQMGNVGKTVKNLLVWAIRPEKNVMLVKGSVPGGHNGLLLVKQSVKSGNK